MARSSLSPFRASFQLWISTSQTRWDVRTRTLSLQTCSIPWASCTSRKSRFSFASTKMMCLIILSRSNGWGISTSSTRTYPRWIPICPHSVGHFPSSLKSSTRMLRHAECQPRPAKVSNIWSMLRYLSAARSTMRCSTKKCRQSLKQKRLKKERLYLLWSQHWSEKEAWIN